MYWYLTPLSLLYGLIVVIRNKFFDWGWIESKKFSIPVISVGNISVGGTGKTPHIEYLINLLIKNHSITTISRGYGRKTKGFVEVEPKSIARDVGDEPLQIKCKFNNTTVIVDEKRVHAIDKLINDNRVSDVILLDDAYQHRHVKPGLNILLIDYNRPITKDFMMPVGRLREPAYNSDRADVVIVTKCPSDMSIMDIGIMQKELNLFPYQRLFFSTFKYNNLNPVFGNQIDYKSIEDLKDISVLVVTGIANPKPLYNKLEQINAKLTKLTFSDHHEFTKSDLNKVVNNYEVIKDKNKVIVCTEKDAVRLKTSNVPDSLVKLPIYSLPIEVTFLNSEELDFNEVINNYINSNRAINL